MDFVSVGICFSAKLDQYSLDGETVTPTLWFESDYVMEGQILVIPVTGKGKCNITLSKLMPSVGGYEKQ